MAAALRDDLRAAGLADAARFCSAAFCAEVGVRGPRFSPAIGDVEEERAMSRRIVVFGG